MDQDYYILQSGTLSRCENTVYFENESVKRDIPIHKIRAIYALGPLSLSAGVIHLFAKEGVPIHFFDYYGNYDGTFVPKEKMPAGAVVIEQARCFLDKEERMVLAVEFIRGACGNILKNLNYYEKEGYRIGEQIRAIEKLLEDIEKKDFEEISEVMNIEGRIRDIYYEAMDLILPEEFQIGRRERRPPTNFGNTLISFGNGLLYATVLSEIYHTHLNPTISYLHSPGERRYSLALDIAEIFKPIIVDRIIFKMTHKKMISPEDFVDEMNGLLLNNSGKKKFLTEWNEKLSTTIHHKGVDRQVSYRQLIRMECYKIEKHIVEHEPYKPLIMWW